MSIKEHKEARMYLTVADGMTALVAGLVEGVQITLFVLWFTGCISWRFVWVISPAIIVISCLLVYIAADLTVKQIDKARFFDRRSK